MNYNLSIIKEIVKQDGYDEKMANILIKLYEFMKKKQWIGACHSISSVLYVILTEIGYNPVLCIGEVNADNFIFDHSWIEIDNKIVDLAISMTLASDTFANAPIILDIDLKTRKLSTLKYGVKGNGIEGEALFVSQCPFSLYMDMFPDNNKGLWGIVEEILDIEINVDKIKEKYTNVERKIVV